MKKYFLLWSLLLLSLPAMALSGQHVQYIGGTVTGIKNGAIGKLDTTSDSSLIFECQGSKLSVPYANIESFQHSREVARHLGGLPVIVVAAQATPAAPLLSNRLPRPERSESGDACHRVGGSETDVLHS